MVTALHQTKISTHFSLELTCEDWAREENIFPQTIFELYGSTTTLFSEIIHGESSFNQNMLILVAGSNLCIMKCGLMGKIAVPSALSLTKWFLLCNKEHIKLVAVFLTLQPFPS